MNIKRLIYRNTVNVFVFHSVESSAQNDRSWVTSTQRFRQQLDLIAEDFEVLTLSDMLAIRRPLRRGKPVACVTFDDGDISWPGVVREELGLRGLRGTFYASTDPLEGKPIWHDRLSFCLDRMRVPRLSVPSLGLLDVPFETPAERARAADQLALQLKYQAFDGREAMLAILETLAGSVPPTPGMNAQHLVMLAELGHEIGSHTCSHPILSHCNAAEAYTEIAESRAILSDMLGQPVKSFSYPNGKPGTDYLAEHVDMVRRAGYESAVSTALGGFKGREQIWQIPRFTPWGGSALSMRRQIFFNARRRPALVEEIPCGMSE